MWHDHGCHRIDNYWRRRVEMTTTPLPASNDSTRWTPLKPKSLWKYMSSKASAHASAIQGSQILGPPDYRREPTDYCIEYPLRRLCQALPGSDTEDFRQSLRPLNATFNHKLNSKEIMLLGCDFDAAFQCLLEIWIIRMFSSLLQPCGTITQIMI